MSRSLFCMPRRHAVWRKPLFRAHRPAAWLLWALALLAGAPAWSAADSPALSYAEALDLARATEDPADRAVALADLAAVLP